jgi:dolichol kinase
MTITEQNDRVQPLRKLIHLSGAAFPLLYLVAPYQVVLIFTLIALALVVAVEWARQRWPALERFFESLIGPALRQSESSKPTGGTWSMLSILITLLICARRWAIPAMLYAQIGDPAAEIVGRRWGRHRMPNGKSLEGSLACFTISLVIGLACCQVLPLAPAITVLGAVVATLAEAISLPPCDNLIMAPLAGLTMKLATAFTSRGWST